MTAPADRSTTTAAPDTPPRTGTGPEPSAAADAEPDTAGERWRYVDHLPPDHSAELLRQDVLTGLAADPKWLPPRWFYDATGSDLFERITELPEYYPTRCEAEILGAHTAEIMARAGGRVLLELGSGSSSKTRLLLDRLQRPGRDQPDLPVDRPGYVSVDVSESALRSAADSLAVDYPDLEITAVRADFTAQLDALPADGPRVVAFLGSTIGNLDPTERGSFLTALRRVLRPGEHLLLGADLVKSPETLVAAYDDAAGVTAAFNRNVLAVLNAELDGDADPADFDHRAVWDPRRRWIEMRLRARRDLRLRFADIGMTVPVRRGEEIRTEISAKFDRDTVRAELRSAGFVDAGWWTDQRGWFSVSLWRAA